MWRVVFGFSVCLIVACGAPQGVILPPEVPESEATVEEVPEEVPAQQDPDWFEKTMAREAEPFEEVQRLESEDGEVVVAVPMPIRSLTGPEDGLYTGVFGIGAEGAMECVFYPNQLDTASATRLVVEVGMDLIEENFGSLEAHGFQGMDAGAVEGAPYLFVEWLYRVPTEAGPSVGHLKHAVGHRGDHSVYCGHDEVGFRDTFLRAFRAVLGGTLRGSTPEAPDFKEVHLIKVGEHQAGFAVVTHRLDDEGDTVIQEQTSLLIPVDGETLLASDSYLVEFADPEGDLINAVSIEAENQEITTNLKLDPTEEGDWQVSGVFSGKDLTALVPWQAVPADSGFSWALRDFLATAEVGDVYRGQDWSPDLDPTQFSDFEVEFLGKEGNDYRVRLEQGLVFEALVDGEGRVRKVSAQMGHLSFSAERILVEGAFPRGQEP